MRVQGVLISAPLLGMDGSAGVNQEKQVEIFFWKFSFELRFDMQSIFPVKDFFNLLISLLIIQLIVFLLKFVLIYKRAVKHVLNII